jgi:transposase
MIFNPKTFPPLYVGIDVAKKFFDINAIDEAGSTLCKFRVTANYQGFVELINQLPDGYQPSFALEDTGPYSGNLLKFLQQTSCEVISSNPFEISRLREVFSPVVKTDSIDAYVLAQSLRMGILKDSKKDVKYIYLQDLLERYYDLLDRKTESSNSLRSGLSQTFPELELVFTNICCIAALTILEHFPSSQLIVGAKPAEIRQLVAQNKGRISDTKIKKLQTLAEETVAWKFSRYHQAILQSQVREIQLIQTQIAEMKNLLEEFISDEEFKLKEQHDLLQTVPGIGTITAYLLLAIIGNPERFDPSGDGKGSKRVSSFVGFGIREYSSGQRMIKKGISKRGNSRLRGMLYMAAMNAVRLDDGFRSSHNRYKEDGGSAKKSLTNIAHTLVRRSYGVLKSGRSYDPKIPVAAGA